MRVLIILVVFCLFPAPLWAQYAQAEPEKQVHWASAAFFGTGWYRVDENRKAFIFRIPPRQVVRRLGHDRSLPLVYVYRSCVGRRAIAAGLLCRP